MGDEIDFTRISDCRVVSGMIKILLVLSNFHRWKNALLFCVESQRSETRNFEFLEMPWEDPSLPLTPPARISPPFGLPESNPAKSYFSRKSSAEF